MEQTKNTYVIYARKSSVDETRQVQSIERQLGDLQRVVEEEKLQVSRRQYVEEQSFFKLGWKVFAELVKATKTLTTILGADGVGKPKLQERVREEEVRSKKREGIQMRSFAEKNTRIKFEKKRLRELASSGLITLDEFKVDSLRLDKELESFRSCEEVSSAGDFQEIVNKLDNCQRTLRGENQDEKVEVVQSLPFDVVWDGGELSLKPDLSLGELLQKLVVCPQKVQTFEPSKTLVINA